MTASLQRTLLEDPETSDPWSDGKQAFNAPVDGSKAERGRRADVDGG